MNELTALLEKVSSGTDPKAPEQLLNAVYNQLRIIARGKMAKERPNHTLQATILVNDAWLKLFPAGSNPKFADRTHFFRAAAKVMRRSLVDHARAKNAIRRGEPVKVADKGLEGKGLEGKGLEGKGLKGRGLKGRGLEGNQLAESPHKASDELIQVMDEALKSFGTKHPSIVELIELRFYVGMTMEEAAKTLGMPKRTAERDCASFAAWFRSKYKEEFPM